MNLGRTARLVATLTYLGLIAATLWLLSLETLAQANWVYPATALVLFTGVVVVVYAVRRLEAGRADKRIHLIALAVAFVGTLLLIFAWTVLEFFGLVNDFQFMGFFTRPGPSGSLGFYVIGAMVALYLVGWVWGRSLYR